jgi:hypothetical protein
MEHEAYQNHTDDECQQLETRARRILSASRKQGTHDQHQRRANE